MTYAPYAGKAAYGIMKMGQRQGSGKIQATNFKAGDSLVLTKRKPVRKSRTSFVNRVADTKAAKHETNRQGVSMTNNTLYTLCPTARVLQGDTNIARDGDAIILCALKLMGFYNTAATAGPYAFRIIVGYSGEEYANTVFASGLGATEIFLPDTATAVSSNGIINPKTFTVLYDEKHTVNSNITAVIDRVDYAITVPLNNFKFPYQSAGSALGKFKNLYVVIVADVVNGVSGTTDVGGTSISWDLIYKNAS